MPITGAGYTGSGTNDSHGYYYLGGTVQDQVTVTSVAGSAINTPTLVLTVYHPDNTTTTPSVTNTASNGLYKATFTPTVAGMHTLRWVASGALVDSMEHNITVKKGATG